MVNGVSVGHRSPFVLRRLEQSRVHRPEQETLTVLAPEHHDITHHLLGMPRTISVRPEE